MMETPLPRQSAKILVFPVAGARAALNLGDKTRFAAEVAALKGRAAGFGDEWYHDAAIEEAAKGSLT